MVGNGDMLFDLMCKLFGLYFVDYYNILCDSVELVYVLGYVVGMVSLCLVVMFICDVLCFDGMIGNCFVM